MSERYEPVIGLEIHVQLNTQTKMFCACENRYGAEPNTLTCPLCLGHPGVLPLINDGAVDRAIAIGLALNCAIAERCQFHRKNYFYPDSPKAYQITQYDEPICGEGHLDVDGHRVGIVRAHLEEDAAKLVHAGGAAGRIAGSEYSVVDFNRCGTPLVEIVTAPDLRSPEQAITFLMLLRTTLRTIGVSDCDMEKGSLRCDANVSVREIGSDRLGTKTELKNMNSFKFLAEGMAAEIARQQGVLSDGGDVEQETLHYDPATRSLSSLRSKEEAHDYRYFPEPDLVPLAPTDRVERIRASLPELPAARMARFRDELGLPEQYATDLNQEFAVADYFESVVANSADPKTAADWVLNQPGLVGTISAAGTASLISLISNGTITPTIAKNQLYPLMQQNPDADPAALVEREGLASIGGGGELESMVDRVIAENPGLVEQFKGGKEGVLNALVGQIMRETKGRADARQVQQLFRDRIG